MRSALLGALFLSVHSLAAAADEVSIQEVLLRAKPGVALVVAEVGGEVTVNCGAGDVTVTPSPFRETGTGWFVSPDGWMITNAHVVSPTHQPPPWLVQEQIQKAVREACLQPLLARRGLQLGQRPDVEDDLSRQALGPAVRNARTNLVPSLSVILSNGIRLSAKVAKYSPPVAGEQMSGRDLALLRLEASDMPALALGDSDRLQLGDPIHILGFPGVVLSHELLNASAKVEASVTSGSVSGFKQDVKDQPVIQTDAPAAWGNSGGPAVTSRGDVVGVLTFVTLDAGAQGGIVQGFNFVIPAAAVKDFLKGTEVDLGPPSKFNTAWHAGLRQFFAGNHSSAARHFAEANRLLPELPDVRRVVAENEDKIRNPPPQPFPWRLVAALVAIVGAGAGGLIWALRWKRNRYRIRPVEVARLLEETTPPPVILDVRDAKTYGNSPVRIPNALHLTAEDLEGGATPSGFEPDRTVVAYCT